MAIFKNLKIFDLLTLDERNTLELFCQLRKIIKWDILIKEGEDANAMYILKDWLLEVYSDSLGHKKKIWLIHEWDIVWEMAVFGSNKKRMATVEAIKDSEVIVLLDFSLTNLVEKYPEIYKKISLIINKRNIENWKK